MFQFIFRAVGFVVLALALVVAVLDLTRSIASSSMVITPFSSLWQSFSPASLETSRVAVESYVHPILWDPIITFALELPSWLLLWTIAMICLWIGQKRKNPYGRFASR